MKFTQTLEDRECRIQDLSEKIYKIKNSEPKEAKTEENWRKLVEENKGYSEMLKNYQTELKDYRSREKKLLKVVHQLK